MDVGQGDGALLISPQGETVLFDNGVEGQCERVKAYLQQLGVTQIDYHIASHYHEDHIGCSVPVLYEFPLQKQAFDRGGTYSTGNFRAYTNIVGPLRKAALVGAGLTLDKQSAQPVRIEFVALNGNGISTRNENDLSLVCVVRFGQFDAVFGGDLSGFNDSGYKDIETSVADNVGQVEVYKVHHHGSKYSSNVKWLKTIQPKVGIVSCGTSNHRHPTAACLTRLHTEGITTYWTQVGNGTPPTTGKDKVGGNMIIEVGPGETAFTVTYDGDKQDTYTVWNPVPGAGTPNALAWSKKAKFYHFANCSYVKSISPANLETGATPPQGKDLHSGCPRK